MIIAAKGTVASAAATPLTYRWVSVGTSGNLYTSDSTTASTWTSRTSSFGTDIIRGVASNGSTLYVAVGDAGKLATSPDGITWTQRTSSFGADYILSVAYGKDGLWCATGASGKLATSPDGITWTQRTSGVATDIGSVFWGNNLWMYGTTAGGLRTATDPTSTWTSRTSTLANPVTVYYDPTDAIWVAGNDTGTTGALASSTDGTTWTARTSSFTLTTPSYFNEFRSIFTSNTTVQACGAGISLGNWDVQSSTDGITWTNRTPADITEAVWCAASDSSGLLVFQGSKVQSSSDGTTWTDRGVTAAGITFMGICHSSGVPAIR